MKVRAGKRGLLLLAACLMTTLISVPSMAAKTKALSGVTVRVGLNIGPGDTLPTNIEQFDSLDVSEDAPAYVGVNDTAKYYISDVEWITSEDRYIKIGEQAKMRIYLEPKDDYSFKGSYSSANVTVKGGTFVSARRESDGVLALVVNLNGLKGQYTAPTDAYWRESGIGRAVWNTEADTRDDYYEATTTEYYDVYLYRGSTVIYRLEDYHGKSYNFYPYMTRKGYYTFRVRTVPHTENEKQYGQKSEWVESDEFYLDEENVSDGSGRTDSNGVSVSTTQVGWIQSGGTWYFRYPNGTYASNGWLQLNGIWYLFDANGRMLTGWQQVKGLWYYMQSNGAMMTGWIKAGNSWYYLNTLADGAVEGSMRTGWAVINGKTYYLDANGAMVEGWREINKKFYYFYPGYGYMATNTWIDTYFYVGADGAWVQNP